MSLVIWSDDDASVSSSENSLIDDSESDSLPASASSSSDVNGLRCDSSPAYFLTYSWTWSAEVKGVTPQRYRLQSDFEASTICTVYQYQCVRKWWFLAIHLIIYNIYICHGIASIMMQTPAQSVYEDCCFSRRVPLTSHYHKRWEIIICRASPSYNIRVVCK